MALCKVKVPRTVQRWSGGRGWAVLCMEPFGEQLFGAISCIVAANSDHGTGSGVLSNQLLGQGTDGRVSRGGGSSSFPPSRKVPKKLSSWGNTIEGVAASCSSRSQEPHADEPSSPPALTLSRSNPLPLERQIPSPSPSTVPAGRRGGGCCVGAAGVPGPRGSAAVLQSGRGRRDPGSESCAGTLDLSLPGWAAPLPEPAVYTQK